MQDSGEFGDGGLDLSDPFLGGSGGMGMSAFGALSLSSSVGEGGPQLGRSKAPVGAGVRAESTKIMAKRFEERERVKTKILSSRLREERQALQRKQKGERRWKKKTERSPFLVDQLAEHERIDEENKIRLEEEKKRERAVDRRRKKVKNEIILKALSEASDLEALRQEKRAIANEEKRLKALLDLERAKQKRKQDVLAAQRALVQRKAAEEEYKRKERIQMVREKQKLQEDLLREKLDVKPPKYENTTFNSFGNDVGCFDNLGDESDEEL